MVIFSSRSSRAGLWALVLLVASVAWSSRARAFDSFHGTRTETLSERAHTAVLTLARDHAELVVRRSIWNAGKQSDQATFYIDLPEGAVATRLRSRGIGPSAPWFEGELLEAEEAAARYKELTGIGGYYPKDPALLSWRKPGLLALQVFPCPPRSEKVVEYTLQLPYAYRGGARHVALPRMGSAELPARVQLVSGKPGDGLLVDGRPFGNGGTLPTPGEEPLDLALTTAAASLEAELVSVPMASGRVLTRVAVRAAPRVSQLPKRAYVVVLVDASRSTGADFEQAAKSAALAYLSHLPDAHVEVMTFDRAVHRQLGGFGTPAAAGFAVQVLSLGQLNGSDVDRALFEADQLLSTAPAGAPRRIVLLTDGLTRSTLTPERLRAALAQSRALVHVGLLHGGASWLQRTDEHVWAEPIRATGGVVWRAGAPSDANLSAEERQEVAAVYEEWARPLRIDNLAVFSDNFSLVDHVRSTSLKEGEGEAELFIDGRASQSLSVTGELWATPVRVLAGAEPAQGKLWSALVFGSPLSSELTEPEMMTLALNGRAVSPVTSYLAIEPGVRPSTDGLEESGGQGWGRGVPRVRMGATKHSGRAPYLDLQAFLGERLSLEYQRCGGTSEGASIDLETTRNEIVRVDFGSPDEPPDGALGTCMTEAVWRLLLPEAFAEDWASFHVDLVHL
jgi:von Willebrand factor type A domain